MKRATYAETLKGILRRTRSIKGSHYRVTVNAMQNTATHRVRAIAATITASDVVIRGRGRYVLTAACPSRGHFYDSSAPSYNDELVGTVVAIVAAF